MYLDIEIFTARSARDAENAEGNFLSLAAETPRNGGMQAAANDKLTSLRELSRRKPSNESLLKSEKIMQIDYRDHIESTPGVLRGKPRIKGSRIPVSLILGYLASGKTYDHIMGEFPDLTAEQISACLDYARQLSEFEVAV